MFERLRSFFSAQKESAAGRVVYMGSRQAQWMPRNYAAFAKEGYQQNVIAYQAIQKFANAFARIPWVLRRRNGQELEDHPLLRLMDRPNPLQSGAEYRRAMCGFYLIAGNAYLEAVRNNGAPGELYTLRPDRMSIKPSNTGMPAGYVYTVNNRKVEWPANPVTGESDIRHLKAFNPLDDWYGMSPIEAGAFSVDQHNASAEWMQSILQNSAMPSGALTVDSENTLSDDAFNRLKAEIDEQYSGAKNAGRPMLLEGGMDWKQMGLSPDDMSVIEHKYASARDVSLAFGVPPLLLNIPGDSTYNNYAEARLAMYEESIIPFAEMVRDELNAWLAPMFGDGLMLDIDLDRVPAIAEKRERLWSMADASEDLTINERRALKGYEPLPTGNSLIPPGGTNQQDVDPVTLHKLAYGPDE